MQDYEALDLLGTSVVAEDSLEFKDPPRLVWIRVRDALDRLWVDNPKRHSIGDLAHSIAKYGVQEIPKFDVNLDSILGSGAIKAGNGRIEALAMMERDGTDPPRGVALHTQTNEWYMPLLIGTDALDDGLSKLYEVEGLLQSTIGSVPSESRSHFQAATELVGRAAGAMNQGLASGVWEAVRPVPDAGDQVTRCAERRFPGRRERTTHTRTARDVPPLPQRDDPARYRPAQQSTPAGRTLSLEEWT